MTSNDEIQRNLRLEKMETQVNDMRTEVNDMRTEMKVGQQLLLSKISALSTAQQAPGLLDGMVKRNQDKLKKSGQKVAKLQPTTFFDMSYP